MSDFYEQLMGAVRKDRAPANKSTSSALIAPSPTQADAILSDQEAIRRANQARRVHEAMIAADEERHAAEVNYRMRVLLQEVPCAPFYKPSSQAIILIVCEKHGIAKAELLGPGRRRQLVAARNEAAYRLREDMDLSLTQIGRLLKRDHTTVLHALTRHAETLGAGGQP